MKKFLGLLLIGVLFLSCSNTTGTSSSATGVTYTGSGFTDNLDSYDSSFWGKADWTNGSMFNCGWLPDHIDFSDSKMKITMNDTASHGKSYSSGEYRTNNTFGYGRFSVNMKPASSDGIVTSFFLYTGNPWDEIDIEFLGKDTTKVQFNYFVNGVGNHEYIHDLGFNASESYHTYAIEWKADSIHWYVDDVDVHSVSGGLLPSHGMYIMMNFWPGTGVDDWLDTFSYSSPLYAYYDWVSYSAN